jgi:WD40 repeat protein
MTSLFISYSRKDIETTRKLTQRFKEQMWDIWIDWDEIPPTVDWWSEIQRGIEESGVFLFFISPDSAQSKICNQEIDYAVRNGKRLVPIVIRDVSPEQVPSALSHLNWIFLREGDDFEIAFSKLISAIDTDYDWVQSHRLLQSRALEWERNGRDNSLLLRITELQDADAQLLANSSKEPFPTDLQREYVSESRKVFARQRRTTRGIAAGVILILVLLSLSSVIQANRATASSNDAQNQAKTAQAAGQLAVDNAISAQAQANISLARELAAASSTHLNLNPLLSLHLALESIDLSVTQQGKDALWQALVAPPVKRVLQGNTGPVYSVSYDPQGKSLLTTGEDGNARIWDVESGEPIKVLHGDFNDAAFSPNGRLVATAGEDGTVRLWDVDSERQLRVLDGHRGRVNSVTFSPDGSRLASASNDRTVRIWQTDSGKEIAIFAEYKAPVRSVTFSPNGAWLATGGEDRSIYVLDAKTAKSVQPPFTMEAGIHALAFSPDSKTLYSDSLNGATSWDIASQTPKFDYEGGHTWDVINVAVDPVDGRQFLTASRDHTVRMWDTKTGKPIEVFRGQSGIIYDVAFSPNGDQMATASEDGTIWTWDLAEWRKRILIGHTDQITNAAYSPDGKRIATVSKDGTIRVWDAKSGKGLNEWKYLNPDSIASGVAFSPDNRTLITSSDDGTWRLWDSNLGLEKYESIVTTDEVHDAQFSHNGTRIITTNSNGLGYIWDARTHELLTKLIGHTDSVATGMFSPDGKWVVTASADSNADLWDSHTGNLLRVFAGHSEAVVKAAFNSDASRIVTASKDGTARIWDTGRGQTLQILKGHLAIVNDAAFSPDDRYVATASRDNTVRLWDAQTGEEIVQFPGFGSEVLSVAFSPDGHYLLATGVENVARIYPVNFKDAFNLASSLASTTSLTCDERAKYLHEECPTPAP